MVSQWTNVFSRNKTLRSKLGKDDEIQVSLNNEKKVLKIERADERKKNEQTNEQT